MGDIILIIERTERHKSPENLVGLSKRIGADWMPEKTLSLFESRGKATSI